MPWTVRALNSVLLRQPEKSETRFMCITVNVFEINLLQIVTYEHTHRHARTHARARTHTPLVMSFHSKEGQQ